MRVIAGPEKKTRLFSEEERRSPRTTSSATRSWVTTSTRTTEVHKISIIGRGQALGYTISPPRETATWTTKKSLMANLAMTPRCAPPRRSSSTR